jgi:hypothetical protein
MGAPQAGLPIYQACPMNFPQKFVRAGLPETFRNKNTTGYTTEKLGDETSYAKWPDEVINERNSKWFASS